MTLPTNRKIVSSDHGRLGRTFIICKSIDSADNSDETDYMEFIQTTYNYTEVANEEEVTGTGDGGFDAYEYGAKHIEGHMECIWDADIQYFGYVDTTDTFEANVPYLNPRGHYEFKGFVNSSDVTGGDGPYLYMGNMRVSNISVTIPSKGKIVLAFDFKSSGSYTMPGAGNGSNDMTVSDAE